MHVENTDELLAWQPPREPMYVGSGLLYRGTTMFIYGRFGTFKSLLTQDLAMKMAQGKPWLHFTTTKARVMVVNTEIPKFLYRGRIEKYVMHNPMDPGAEIYWITEHFFKLDQAGTLSSLIGVLKNYRPEVLIIDPWYKTLSGDISDSTGVQRILDRLDEIKTKFGLALVMVGHTRKPSNEGVADWGLELMGSSHVQNWADTSIAIESLTSKSIRLHFPKSRNATEELQDTEVTLDRQTLRFIV